MYIQIVSIVVIVALAFAFYIFNRIQEKFAEEDPMIADLRNTLSPYFPELNKVILMRGKKSYTINKKRVHLCLVDKDGKYYDKHMLIYVTLHELAHTMCSEVGHTELFHKIFQELLQRATNHGIYDMNKPIVKDYCMY